MNRIKRTDRIGAIVKLLSDKPNKSFSLKYLSDLFGAAKSTISEDITIVRNLLNKFDMGDVKTIVGAAGGVVYTPFMKKDNIKEVTDMLCKQLDDAKRILPGGFVYITDLLYRPEIIDIAGLAMSSLFEDSHPDFIITVETKGIPLAMSVARYFNCPLVVARRDNKVTEGSVVTINYVSASSKRIQTMSLARRAVKNGQKALIIDDFMKGGGTVKGIYDLLYEFDIEIIGACVMIETKEPQKKMVSDYKSLVTLESVDESSKKLDITPSNCIL